MFDEFMADGILCSAEFFILTLFPGLVSVAKVSPNFSPRLAGVSKFALYGGVSPSSPPRGGADLSVNNKLHHIVPGGDR